MPGAKRSGSTLTLDCFIGEAGKGAVTPAFLFRGCTKGRQKAVIIGAGPAGLFAALQLTELGIQPSSWNGADVRARRRDLALLNKEGLVNPESNYCFGEGGAGTYSDGKLYIAVINAAISTAY